MSRETDGQRAARRKQEAAEFWPNNARAFAKKFAELHSTAWAILLQQTKGDKAKLLEAIGQLLAGEYKVAGPANLARALLSGLPKGKKARCGFCGKSSDVVVLVEGEALCEGKAFGKEVYICESCTKVAAEVLERQRLEYEK